MLIQVTRFIHSFNKYQQSSFYMPGTILNAGNMKLMKETQTLKAGTWGNPAGVNRTTGVCGHKVVTPDPSSQACRRQRYQFFYPHFCLPCPHKAGPQAQSLGFSAVTRIIFWLPDRMQHEKEGVFLRNQE